MSRFSLQGLAGHLIKIMFQKGYIPWNKETSREQRKILKEKKKDIIICNQCGKKFKVWQSRIKEKKGKYCSLNCYNKSKRGKPAWNKGLINNPKSYSGIHNWLHRKYGNANKCEICGEDNKKYQWAKLKDKEYERKRENFWQLCVKCHTLYDKNLI